MNHRILRDPSKYTYTSIYVRYTQYIRRDRGGQVGIIRLPWRQNAKPEASRLGMLNAHPTFQDIASLRRQARTGHSNRFCRDRNSSLVDLLCRG